MRVPRSLRVIAAGKKPRTVDADEQPAGYRYSQTDGYAITERAGARTLESGDHWGYGPVTPVVFGFRPNP